MKPYTIKSIKAWGQGDMYSVTFEEYSAEPVDYKEVGAVPKPGETVIGKIEEYTTLSGNIRKKFVTQEFARQEDMRQLEINSSWAIGIATQIAPDYDKDTIKATAQMVLEIKKELIKEETSNVGE